MKLYDALDEMCEKAGTTLVRLSFDQLNSNSYEAQRSRNSKMRVDIVARIAEGCGYSLCLIPYDLVPRCAIEISPWEDGK